MQDPLVTPSLQNSFRSFLTRILVHSEGERIRAAFLKLKGRRGNDGGPKEVGWEDRASLRFVYITYKATTTW